MTALRGQRKADLEDRRRELTTKQKTVWAALLERQRHERAAFAEEQRIIARRLKAYLKSKDDKWVGDTDKKNWVSLGFDIAANAAILKAAMAERHQAERRALALKHKAFNDEKLKPLRKAWDDDIASRRKLFAGENRALADRHRAESEVQAAEIAKGGGRVTHDFEDAARPPADPSHGDTFEKAATERVSSPILDPPAPEEVEPAKRRFSAFQDARNARRRARDGEDRDGFSAFRDSQDGKDRQDGRGRRRHNPKPDRSGEPE